MKHLSTLFVLVLLLAGTQVRAQLPNSSFENLNADSSISHWGMSIVTLVFIDSNGVAHTDSSVWDIGPVFTTTDAHSGTRAMEMRNGFDYTSNSAMAGGSQAFGDTTFSYNQVFITGQPIDLNFYYKFYPLNDDTAFASVGIFDSTGTQIGDALVLLNGTTSSYTLSTTPINYTASGVPSVATIFFCTNNGINGHQPTVGTRLLVDDVAFTNTTGIKEANAEYDMTVYPNPTTSIIKIKSPYAGVTEIAVYNAIGEKVKTAIGQNQLDINELPAGVYQLLIRTENSTICKKISKL
jgi:hypothetical protein